MADQFLRLILDHTRIFADTQQLFDFVRRQFGQEQRSGTLFWFGKLRLDVKLDEEDLFLNGRSLVQTLERQYIDFPEYLGLYFA